MTKRGETSPLRGRKYQKEAYTREEVLALLSRTSSDHPSAIRNYALIATLWQSGLRMNEALMMRPHDFNLAAPEIHVRYGKGAKGKGPRERRVQPGPQAVQAVARWLAVRRDLELPDDAPLFCTLEGKKLHSTYFRNTLFRLSQGAGWTKRCHPHGFRHTFAVTLVRSGVSPAIIQRQLGHASLATTTIYLTALSTDDITEAMERVEW